MGKATPAKELNLVILGSKSAPKHLVGNLILGRNVFDAADSFDCERRAGEVFERDVTLVKAPGWLRGYNPSDSPELVRREMVLSVTLCPRQPHGFLLAINAEQSFRRVHRKSTVQHLEQCFGEKVWSHTDVVFFRRGPSDESIEDFIRNEGPPLESLLEACGNRYHTLCEDGADDNVAKVKELFGKIEAMVAQNGCYEVEKALVQNAKEQRKGVEEKAQELSRQSQQRRQILRNLLSEPKPQLRILTLGWLFSEKTASGNTILSDQVFQASDRTVKVLKRSGTVAGREVVIVDTPGWWKFFPAAFNLSAVKSEILSGVNLCRPAPNVVLLAVPLDTSFTEEQRRVTEDNMRPFGPRVWQHVIPLFTSGDVLGQKTIEQHIESEGKPLRWLVQKSGGRYHVIDNRSRERAQVTELLDKMEEMIAGNSCLYLSEACGAPPEREGGDGLGEEEDEGGAKEISEQLNIEWNRKNWELYHVWKCDKSIDIPLNFKEEGETSQQKEGDQASIKPGTSAEVESEEEDDSSPASKNIKALLEREWSRREIYHEHCADKTVIAADVVQESPCEVLTWLENLSLTWEPKTDKDNKRGKIKSVPQPTNKQKTRKKKTKRLH